MVVGRAQFLDMFLQVCICQWYRGTFITHSNVLLGIEVSNRIYTGTQIVYTSAIAALNLKLVFKNICVYITLEKHLEREF